jgi:hypothetical protein
MAFDPAYMPVDTENFDEFFNDESIRREVLQIIQDMKSLNQCEEELGPEEYMDWRDRIMEMVNTFANMYDNHGLPEMKLIDCDAYNNNSNVESVGQLNQAFNAGHGNNAAMAQLMANLGYVPPQPAPVNVPNSGQELHLPANAANAITSENIKEGNILVDFGNEYGEDRFHLKSSFNKWKTLPSGHKENPYTRAAIENARTFRATFAPPPLEGGRRTRRKGLKKRSRRRRST